MGAFWFKVPDFSHEKPGLAGGKVVFMRRRAESVIVVVVVVVELS